MEILRTFLRLCMFPSHDSVGGVPGVDSLCNGDIDDERLRYVFGEDLGAVWTVLLSFLVVRGWPFLSLLYVFFPILLRHFFYLSPPLSSSSFASLPVAMANLIAAVTAWTLGFHWEISPSLSRPDHPPRRNEMSPQLFSFRNLHDLCPEFHQQRAQKEEMMDRPLPFGENAFIWINCSNPK